MNVVISGHCHNYERTFPIFNETVRPQRCHFDPSLEIPPPPPPPMRPCPSEKRHRLYLNFMGGVQDSDLHFMLVSLPATDHTAHPGLAAGPSHPALLRPIRGRRLGNDPHHGWHRRPARG